MENLETAQVIGETVTKAFDKKEDAEKKEGFMDLIENLDENDSIKWLKEKRNSLTEDQKSKLYKKDAINLKNTLTNGSFLYKYYRTIINGTVNTAKNGGKNAAKYALLEQIPCRFLVELGILKKPEGLTKEQLIKDVKKDAKNYNAYIGICEIVCMCIPEAQPAVPFIQMAKHYTKWYKNHGTEVIEDRLNSQKESDIKDQTNKELSIAMSDIENQNKAA